MNRLTAFKWSGRTADPGDVFLTHWSGTSTDLEFVCRDGAKVPYLYRTRMAIDRPAGGKRYGEWSVWQRFQVPHVADSLIADAVARVAEFRAEEAEWTS